MQLAKKSVRRHRNDPPTCVDFTRKLPKLTKHYWPSNFFIEPDGTCVEVEFQIAKHEGHPWRQWIIQRNFERTGKPANAKRLGRKFRLTPEELEDWNRRRVDVMFQLVLQKVVDHPSIGEQLGKTGDGEIIEDNWWHDNYWGRCLCMNQDGRHPECAKRDGWQNWLGETLMTIRTDIR